MIVGASVAAHKFFTPIGLWAASNVAVLSQISIGGAGEVVAYVGGVTVPFGIGWALWQNFLKAQNQTEAYLVGRTNALQAENDKLRETLNAERRRWEDERAHLVELVRLSQTPLPPKEKDQ